MKYLIILIIAMSSINAQRIKLATLAPKNSAWYDVLDEYAKEVEKLTGGKVEFKIYDSGRMGNESTALSKIRLGQLHAGAFIGPGLGQIVPAIRVLDLPFLFQNDAEVDHVLDNTFQYFQDEFAKKDFHFLAWAGAGFANIYSSEPIRNYDDLKKTKLVKLENDPLIDLTFEALDLDGIPDHLINVLTSLSTGRVNTTYAPPLGAVSLQWFKYEKYMIDVNFVYAAGAVIISNSIWDKIKPEHQKIMNDQAKIYFAKFRQV
ncbi:MAG: TRAP transporter substrate-binding protein DctP, partial [Calditrichaeota bacterium]|nr:TRAP transporter substrate-binding protein DctP [Calditrichota bacterium]